MCSNNCDGEIVTVVLVEGERQRGREVGGERSYWP